MTHTFKKNKAMKTNEAPEKIYLPAIDLKTIGGCLAHSNDTEDVEYTRTDAFIEKACEWLDKNLIEYWEQTNEVPDIFIEDFRNYLKE